MKCKDLLLYSLAGAVGGALGIAAARWLVAQQKRRRRHNAIMRQLDGWRREGVPQR